MPQVKPVTDIKSAVERWTNNKFRFRSSFYTARGVCHGDLNSKMLEDIYQGLKNDVGQAEASNFVLFVNSLKDMSASAFIQAFEQFWHSGCNDVDFEQEAGSGDQLTGHGDALLTEAIILANAMSRGKTNQGQIEIDSWVLKSEFIREHTKEIPTGEINRPDSQKGTRLFV